MNNSGNNRKKTNSLLSQLLIVLLLIIAVSLWLHNLNLIKFPDFIENIISSGEEELDSYTQKGYEIFEYINTEKNAETTRLYPSLESASLSDIISNLDTYENFFWESTSTVYYGNKETAKHCKSRISGDRYNVEILDSNGRLIKKCVSDGERVQISDTDGYFETVNNYRQGIIDFYSDASVISLDYFSSLDFSQTDAEIYRITDSDYNLISVSFSYERGGIIVLNNYLLSLDFGIVLFAESYENDRLVYKLSTDSVYSLPSLDDEIFQLN